MADKVVSGIGRELRYIEYKLRKKQTKGNKKNKNGMQSGELAWSTTPTSDEFRSPTSEELQKAMPSNKGEEALQIQVALAMSREEQNERSRQTQSDDLRLKLALEESKKDTQSRPVATQSRPVAQPSLLDLSMNAPKPAASVQSPGTAGANLFGPTATNDPWGAAAPSAPTAPASFDPFASSAPAGVTSAPYPTATSGAAWGAPQAAPVATQDPWGGGQNVTVTPPANSFAPPTQPDPWGAAPAQGAFPQQNGNTWGTPDPFASAQPPPTYDPFSGTTGPIPQSQSNGFGMAAPAPVLAKQVDPFGSAVPSLPPQQPTNSFAMPTSLASTNQPPVSDPFGMSGPSATFTAPPFDPLKDFDQLHISTTNGHRGPDPVLLTNDMTSGRSVAKDIFPIGQVLEPMPITATYSTEATTMPAMTKQKETDLFLGENSGLVNLDSGWKTYQVPYCTKPLGTQAHNPFQQTGPTKTLNEMKSTKQPGFP